MMVFIQYQLDNRIGESFQKYWLDYLIRCRTYLRFKIGFTGLMFHDEMCHYYFIFIMESITLIQFHENCILLRALATFPFLFIQNLRGVFWNRDFEMINLRDRSNDMCRVSDSHFSQEKIHFMVPRPPKSKGNNIPFKISSFSTKHKQSKTSF